MSKELIQVQFDLLHRQMLLHAPRDIESLFIQGVLMGYRDTLNKRGVVVEGVTNQWWFEHQQGPTFEVFLKRVENDVNKIEKQALKAGFKEGAAQVVRLGVEIVHYTISR